MRYRPCSESARGNADGVYCGCELVYTVGPALSSSAALVAEILHGNRVELSIAVQRINLSLERGDGRLGPGFGAVVGGLSKPPLEIRQVVGLGFDVVVALLHGLESQTEKLVQALHAGHEHEPYRS